MNLTDCHVALKSPPEYRPYAIYPLPEPDRAGKDASQSKQASRELLRVADEIIRSERERADVYGEALDEAWSVIRELRQTIEAKDERYAALEDYAGCMTRAARRCV